MNKSLEKIFSQKVAITIIICWSSYFNKKLSDFSFILIAIIFQLTDNNDEPLSLSTPFYISYHRIKILPIK